MPLSVEHTRVSGETQNIDAWAPGDKEPQKRNLIRWYMAWLNVLLGERCSFVS